MPFQKVSEGYSTLIKAAVEEAKLSESVVSSLSEERKKKKKGLRAPSPEIFN